MFLGLKATIQTPSQSRLSSEMAIREFNTERAAIDKNKLVPVSYPFELSVRGQIETFGPFSKEPQNKGQNGTMTFAEVKNNQKEEQNLDKENEDGDISPDVRLLNPEEVQMFMQSKSNDYDANKSFTNDSRENVDVVLDDPEASDLILNLPSHES